MYKPHTIAQFKVLQYLKEQGFVLECFLLSPVSRDALMVEDRTGDKLAFEYRDGLIKECPIPIPAPPEAVEAFFREFRAAPDRPTLSTCENVTRWWLNHKNPLTYQQALGLPDDLYRHFLGRKPYDEVKVRQIVQKSVVTEEEFRGVLLWYYDGNAAENWMGPEGIDGTGERYGVTFQWFRPEAEHFTFYLENDYYRYMNKSRL